MRFPAILPSVVLIAVAFAAPSPIVSRGLDGDDSEALASNVLSVLTSRASPKQLQVVNSYAVSDVPQLEKKFLQTPVQALVWYPLSVIIDKESRNSEEIQRDVAVAARGAFQSDYPLALRTVLVGSMIDQGLVPTQQKLLLQLSRSNDADPKDMKGTFNAMRAPDQRGFMFKLIQGDLTGTQANILERFYAENYETTWFNPPLKPSILEKYNQQTDEAKLLYIKIATLANDDNIMEALNEVLPGFGYHTNWWIGQ